MYSNDEVKGYLVVRIGGDSISPGWLETGIVSKCLHGSLNSKPNQVDYVIPLSTTAKAIIDRRIRESGDAGIFIYGEHGLSTEKLVISFRVSQESESVIRTLSAFRISGYSPHDIVRLVLKYEFGRELSGDRVEPGIDYVEYLRNESSVDSTLEGFSIRIPASWPSPRTWIQEVLMESEGDTILLRQGKISDCASLSILLSNWVAEMVENLLIRDPVAACLFIREGKTESFFWDGPRDIMTAALLSGSDLEKISMHILTPLWADSADIMPSVTRTKEVVVGDFVGVEEEGQYREDKISSEKMRLLAKINRALGDIDVLDTLKRIERIESILSELERLGNRPVEEAQTSKSNHLDSRIRDVLERFEALNERLATLEKRIQAIVPRAE
jgi:hypothetical protein